MYINYDLARSILEERRNQAATRALTRRRSPDPEIVIAVPEADVIELTFGAHCESEQIGA